MARSLKFIPKVKRSSKINYLKQEFKVHIKKSKVGWRELQRIKKQQWWTSLLLRKVWINTSFLQQISNTSFKTDIRITFTRSTWCTRSGLSIGERYIGVNKLSTMMKSMCQEGGLNGNITNHSGKRIYGTGIYEVGTKTSGLYGAGPLFDQILSAI